mmetsp:Transcript_75834/g.214408  ORF Transcript_75834/g.214408 Transcript_75834/m.214408 type:complete len:749 (-) Transcript_75834:61-2307(-)
MREGWYSFGRGVHGELGRRIVADGARTSPGLQNTDVQPVLLAAEAGGEEPAVASLACGHFHSLAIADGGQVFAWGANGAGQLGIPSESSQARMPLRTLEPLADQLEGEAIAQCAGGRSHSVFLSAPSGRCFVAGKLQAAELAQRGEDTVEEGVREINLVDSGGKSPQGRVVSCDAGESTTLFVTSEGEVWSWLESRTARSTPYAGMERPTARAVLGLPKVARVACGWYHTLVLTEDRSVFTFGTGCFGQLGLGSCKNCPSPSQVAMHEECEGKVADIAAGFASSFAVTAQGRLYAWGANEKCQLGLGASLKGAATPKPVDALSRAKVLQVSAGFSHTACVTRDGLLYLWGFGAYGQLGFEFSSVKSSQCLGAGNGAVSFSATGRGLGSDPEISANAGPAGTTSIGHSRPWLQTWPRRCLRGPFGSHRCAQVQCGAHHTFAHASAEALDAPGSLGAEILTPAPLELSDLPAAGAGAAEDAADAALGAADLPPGAGLVESPKSVLREGAGLSARNTETFRKLAGLFWGMGPNKGPAAEPPPSPRKVHAVEDGEWRRALVRVEQKINLPAANFTHPLARGRKSVQVRANFDFSDKVMQLPHHDSPSTWDAVDEAVHRAFCNGSAADPTVKLDLAELVAGVGDEFEPELPGGEMQMGLPPAPCRGLARMECLTPRPFYLPSPDGDPDDYPFRPKVVAKPSAWSNLGLIHGKAQAAEAKAPEEPPDAGSPGNPGGPAGDAQGEKAAGGWFEDK